MIDVALISVFVFKVSAWDQPAVIVMVVATIALAIDGGFSVRRLRDPKALSSARRNWLLFASPCRLIIGLPLVMTGVIKALRWLSPGQPTSAVMTAPAMSSVMPIMMQLLGLVLVATAWMTIHQAWKRR